MNFYKGITFFLFFPYDLMIAMIQAILFGALAFEEFQVFAVFCFVHCSFMRQAFKPPRSALYLYAYILKLFQQFTIFSAPAPEMIAETERSAGLHTLIAMHIVL